MKNILLFFGLVLSTCIFAQLENIPLVTVIGNASVKVKPDHAIIGIKINKSIKLNASGNAFEIFKSEDTKIKLFGFDDKNIYESYIQADSLVYVKEVFITINDLNTLDKYLLELYKLGYKDYIYLEYRVKDHLNCKNQARKEALISAKKKAALMATELGQTIGKAHKIEELEAEDLNWYNIDNTKNLENVTYKKGSDTYIIEPGFITFTSKIKVSYDLVK